MTRTIDVLGKPHEVNVQRTYKTVWIVVGEYGGTRIQVTKRSEQQALAAWLLEATNVAKTTTAGSSLDMDARSAR
jgi:hypothetical protein